MPLCCQEWKGLTVQKGTRGLWQGLTEVNATSTVHSDLRNWLISFSSKGAQEILSYSLAKVNYTNIPWRNSHMPCAVQTQWALCPTGRDQTALTPSRLPHHPKGFVATAPRYSILSSWGLLPHAHLTLKQKAINCNFLWQRKTAN